MSITKDNYEQYFLDHVEGNLSPELERELSDFLDANPDLKSILDEYTHSPILPEIIKNDNLKKRLKKNTHPTAHINEDNVDEWMINGLEGLIGDDKENELNEFLELNPAYSYDQKIFGLTRQVPDQAVIFNGKERLKKRGILIPLPHLYWILPASAAIVLLFIGIRYFQQPEVEHGTLPLVVEAPSQIQETPSKVAEIITDIQETPSQFSETPSQFSEAPSQIQENQFQVAETPSQYTSFRMDRAIVKDVFIAAPEYGGQNLDLLAYNFFPVQTVEAKEKPLIAKIFGNMLAKVKDGVGRNTDGNENSLPEFSFWTIAQASVKGYNSISDRDLELYVSKDDEGKVKSYALINNDKLLLERELNKE